MNKLLVITVLIALFSFGAQGFRVPRQAEEEEVVAGAPEEVVAEETVVGVPEEVVAEEAAAEVHEEVVAEAHEEVAPEEPAPEEPVPEEPVPEEPVAEVAPEEHAPEAVPDVVAPEEPEGPGPFTMAFDAIRHAWDTSVDTAHGWLETVRGLKLEEKAKSLYEDTANAVTTYSGILHDQMYHLIYSQ
ncbi:apolipoprotein C-II [Megalops cyprinoides]|uniref:apolipoprotein C-II n=1 Tax=Megalops cyprinoides TaxID=118141 RepID=UPI00186539DE|nr:apolipoprotein C-II [Megalops cyprinoides]